MYNLENKGLQHSGYHALAPCQLAINVTSIAQCGEPLINPAPPVDRVNNLLPCNSFFKDKKEIEPTSQHYIQVITH
jgi:hypothetical protein